MSLIQFGIVGAGWRSEFYLRISQLIPDRFRVAGMVVRNEKNGESIEKRWGIKTYRTVDEMLRHSDISFAIISIPRAAAPSMTLEMVRKGVPVLCETPPAELLQDMTAFYESVGPQAKVQIAEQYLFQPNHVARLNIIHSGLLGTVSQAQVSAAHDYHGISLIRRYLGVHFEDATIRALSFQSPIIDGPNREGNPTESRTVTSTQVIATLEFGDKLGVYDFTGDQYFSWIRSPRLLIRGDKGEINNFRVSYLKDHLTPVNLELRRTTAGDDGNLEGYYLKNIMCGDNQIYKNDFIPGRLSDEEIAVAACLDKMDRYVKGDQSFYSLAEASQDHYLGLMIAKALQTGESVTTSKQIWTI